MMERFIRFTCADGDAWIAKDDISMIRRVGNTIRVYRKVGNSIILIGFENDVIAQDVMQEICNPAVINSTVACCINIGRTLE